MLGDRDKVLYVQVNMIVSKQGSHRQRKYLTQDKDIYSQNKFKDYFMHARQHGKMGIKKFAVQAPNNSICCPPLPPPHPCPILVPVFVSCLPNSFLHRLSLAPTPIATLIT